VAAHCLEVHGRKDDSLLSQGVPFATQRIAEYIGQQPQIAAACQQELRVFATAVMDVLLPAIVASSLQAMTSLLPAAQQTAEILTGEGVYRLVLYNFLKAAVK
jgi:hypothetical protein